MRPPLLPIRHCVSLGPTCNAAEYLRCHPAGPRRYALPFDWMHTDSSLICACVADGCEALLDRRSLQSADRADRTGGGDQQHSSRWPVRRCLNRNFRTAQQAHALGLQP